MTHAADRIFENAEVHPLGGSDGAHEAVGVRDGRIVRVGSGCMPLDPLYGVQQAVTAPQERQRLTVTEALSAYTVGAAYAGHDEDRVGTIEDGKQADLVLLEDSPWAVEDDAIADIDVAMTVVDGEVVYRK